MTAPPLAAGSAEPNALPFQPSIVSAEQVISMQVDLTLHATGTPTEVPQRAFVISQQQGAAWLQFMAEISRGRQAVALMKFRDTVADACWIARWSRNYVTLDVPISELPAIIDDLVQLSQHALCHPQAQVGDEIIRCLSVNFGVGLPPA